MHVCAKFCGSKPEALAALLGELHGDGMEGRFHHKPLDTCSLHRLTGAVLNTIQLTREHSGHRVPGGPAAHPSCTCLSFLPGTKLSASPTSPPASTAESPPGPPRSPGQ
jgi:hypothetical protein